MLIIIRKRTDRIIRLILKPYILVVAALILSACATTRAPAPDMGPETSDLPPEITSAPPANPEPAAPSVDIPERTPEPELKPEPELGPAPEPEPPVAPEIKATGAFADLSHWAHADPTPALKAFQKTCDIWKSRPDGKLIDAAFPQFGYYGDWRASCTAAMSIKPKRSAAARFFQTYFEPVNPPANTGLLTGYYAPEIPVRRLASREFSEPILAKPEDPKIQSLPRKDLSVTSSKVLAYGRPVDVFFLQIQGSGQIRFPDGNVYRAAFDGHNNKPYVSIGKLMLARGDLHRDKAGKQDIEEWMAKAGYLKTKALMAENPRYIFFKTEHIVPGEGPKGAMGVPLTPMGSLAVDESYLPYGAIVWLQGKFPVSTRDYTGSEAGHLLVAQDTGGAIIGENRGDVFFGSGPVAGDKAGVMKHQVKWTLFLPVALALKYSGVS